MTFNGFFGKRIPWRQCGNTLEGSWTACGSLLRTFPNRLWVITNVVMIKVRCVKQFGWVVMCGRSNDNVVGQCCGGQRNMRAECHQASKIGCNFVCCRSDETCCVCCGMLSRLHYVWMAFAMHLNSIWSRMHQPWGRQAQLWQPWGRQVQLWGRRALRGQVFLFLKEFRRVKTT